MRKLICKMFGHKYIPGQEQFVHVKDDVFRVTQCCIYCGEKTCCLVHIPLPDAPKKGEGVISGRVFGGSNNVSV